MLLMLEQKKMQSEREKKTEQSKLRTKMFKMASRSGDSEQPMVYCPFFLFPRNKNNISLVVRGAFVIALSVCVYCGYMRVCIGSCAII